MKVYYDVSEAPSVPDFMIQGIIDALPEQLKKPMANILESNLDLQTKLIQANSEKMKFKIMWALRSMEDEINESGGSITLYYNGRIDTAGFSDELSDRIISTINKYYE